MTKNCQTCGVEFEARGNRHYCDLCSDKKKSQWYKQANYKFDLRCEKCGKTFEGWYRNHFCTGCRDAERYKRQLAGIEKYRFEKAHPPAYVRGEVWAKMILAMMETCNGDKECWTCTVNYFCQYATWELADSHREVLTL